MTKRSKRSGSKGFTLTEALLVVGIIAIACAIAIPAISSVKKSLSFKQKNDYAKSLFLAAQSSLTEKRSNGQLTPLQRAVAGLEEITEDVKTKSQFPGEDWSDEYRFTVSGTTAFDLVIPPNSVDNTVRDKTVLVEFNPFTGNVYSVFYSESMTAEEMRNAYLDSSAQYPDGLPRDDEGARKKMMLGYYCGSGLSSSELEHETTNTKVECVNGPEFLVTAEIGLPDQFAGRPHEFAQDLSVDFKITDESGNTFTVTVSGDDPQYFSQKLGGDAILVTYALDSLKDLSSFANLSHNAWASGAAGAQRTAAGAITNAAEFTIQPGANVTIDVESRYTGPLSLTIEDGHKALVNPMFESMQKDASGSYIIYVSNGRNLQNLNLLHPDIAKNTSTIVFPEDKDIYWRGGPEGESIVEYYQDYSNNVNEAPGRCLPYFVPIHNQYLFGTAQLILPQLDDGSLNGAITNWVGPGIAINTEALKHAPMLSDGFDTDAASHAKVYGNGSRIHNISIDATKYPVVREINKMHYAAGPMQMTDYNFAGLFAYVNTVIDDLHMVNPIVKGQKFATQDPIPQAEGADKYKNDFPYPQYAADGKSIASYYYPGEVGILIHRHHALPNQTATGAMVGATGSSALLTNCSVYIDDVAGFSAQHQEYYNPNAPQYWYGVSGQGAVGGLVGYAKSSRTVSGALSGDISHLAFSKCFAAVPVSGAMRENMTLLFTFPTQHYGFSNGIGGLVGVANMANFFDCYASGNIKAQNYFVDEPVSNLLPDWISEKVPFNGRTSWGAGGFVGTSHGTRYSNCFATGEVTGSGLSNFNTKVIGSGAFVGVMTIDGTKLYGADDGMGNDVAQYSVFTNCYATGVCKGTTKVIGLNLFYKMKEGFLGVPARISTDDHAANKDRILDAYNNPDYYKNAAAYYLTSGGSLPPFDGRYIFRDSYYITVDRSQSGNYGSASTVCARAISYNDLKKLPKSYRESSFRDGLLVSMKDESLNRDFWNRFKDSYSGNKNGCYTGTYNSYFEVAALNHISGMDSVFTNAYNQGFPAEHWFADNPAELTHPYDLNRAGQTYPFPQIKDLPYYGNWTNSSPAAGLAYFEKYKVTTDAEGEPLSRPTEEIGLKFDNDATSSLRNDSTILYDGYVYLASSDSPVYVTFYDKNNTVIGESSYTLRPERSTIFVGDPERPGNTIRYHRTLITPEIIKALKCDDGFYLKAVFTQDGVPCTCYFNPNVALSQVNALNGLTATRPTGIPSTLLIRTERQFHMLSHENMDSCLGENFHYVQQFDLDASRYNWNNAKFTPEEAMLSSIGSNSAFMGSYSAINAPEGVVTIANFIPDNTKADTGIFSHIGSTGKVSNLDFRFNLTGPVGDAAVSEHTGLVAGKSEGTLSKLSVSDVNAKDAEGSTTAITLNAKEGAGLMAGLSTGTISQCSLRVADQNPVTVKALRSGGVIGMSNGSTITGFTHTRTGLLTLSGTYGGGFIGTAGDTAFHDITVNEGQIISTAGATGGFAGYLADKRESSDGAALTDITVNVSGTIAGSTSQTSYTAGFAGETSNVTLANINVTLDKELSGTQAAGLLGLATNTGVDASAVNLKGGISGTVSASGAVTKLNNDHLSTLDSVAVNLKGGKIHSDTETGKAVGFAAEINSSTAGTGSHTGFQLKNCSFNFAGGTQITGTGNTSGFADSVKNSRLHSCRVYGTGTIVSTGGNASGFANNLNGANTHLVLCGVTPVIGHETGVYLGNSNANLVVKGKTSSGFVNEVTAQPSLSSNYFNAYNCFALCSLQGTDASNGFVTKNGGILEGCTANVTLTGGNAFTAENNGLIMDCYGWFGDGAQDGNTTNTIPTLGTDAKILSSYFADIDHPILLVPEGAQLGDKFEQHRSATLFDASGANSQVIPTSISPDMLNRGATIWSTHGTFPAHPYNSKLAGQNYPMPMLGDHYGDWAKLADASCGIAYFEKYKNTDGTVEYAVFPKNMGSEEFHVVEDWFYSGNLTAELCNQLDIVDSGYAVFYMTGLTGDNLPFDPAIMHPEAIPDIDEFILGDISHTFHEIIPGNLEGASAEFPDELKITTIHGDVTIIFSPLFAKEFETRSKGDKNFEVRTGDQLSNIGIIEGLASEQVPPDLTNPGDHPKNGNVFNQTHEVIVKDGEFTDEDTVNQFGGTYNGGGHDIIADSSFTWIDTVDGQMNNMGNIQIKNSADKPLIKNMFTSSTLEAKSFHVDGDLTSPDGFVTTTQTGVEITLDDVKVTGSITGCVIKSGGGGLRIHNLNVDSIGAGGSIVETLNGGALYLYDEQTSIINIGTMDGPIVNRMIHEGNFSTKDMRIGTMNVPMINSCEGSNVNYNVGHFAFITIENMNAPIVDVMKEGVGNINQNNGAVTKPSSMKNVYLTASNVNINVPEGSYAGLLVNSFTNDPTVALGEIYDSSVNAEIIDVKGAGTFGILAGYTGEHTNVRQCAVNGPKPYDSNFVPKPTTLTADSTVTVGDTIGKQDGAAGTNTVNNLTKNFR